MKPSDYLNRYLELKRREAEKTIKNPDDKKAFNKLFQEYVIDDAGCDWLFNTDDYETEIVPEAVGLELYNIYYAYEEAIQNEKTEELVDGVHKAVQFFKRISE